MQFIFPWQNLGLSWKLRNCIFPASESWKGKERVGLDEDDSLAETAGLFWLNIVGDQHEEEPKATTLRGTVLRHSSFY